jgi:hypothetical protein
VQTDTLCDRFLFGSALFSKTIFMEHLNKQQVVLLTLLVSFVSSIATGIVTVSLLDQAPVGVTQTINNVIEKTVERVVPSENGAAVVTKETVIVSEDEATTNAIEKATKSIVRIRGVRYDGVDFFAGFGVIVSPEGHIVARLLKDPNTIYRGVFLGGNEVTLVSLREDPINGLVLFETQNGSGENARAFTAGTLSDVAKIKLGQKAIAIGGEMSNAVIASIISGIDEVLPNSSLPVSNEIQRVRASVYAQSFLSHSVLVNLSGEFVGLKVGTENDEGYIPSNIIKKLIPSS